MDNIPIKNTCCTVAFSWRTEKNFIRPNVRKVKLLATRIAQVAGTGLDQNHSLGVSFLSSAKMAEVNMDFLTHKGDTDVICFDYRGNGEDDFIPDEDNTGVDILICPAVAFREAQKRNLPYAREVTLYLVHGLLHAAGFDDLKPELKRKMRRAEKRVLSVIEKEFDLADIFLLAPEVSQ